ncbi:D-alanyl-D-alanine carboxypeptidase [Streptomyces albidus (ex Kaewkla and Franco 2022)]|uniref:D-alanyl-D-alanine carboxypeptidase n=1 Tax=Streptomyces albidus (ex Kaewkla and Franco 2022) TaxID=722709 RepID=UPI002815397B|nr:D-alanyl-D-alanine carboxypeptidase [Streptomyces albidus (ex Kaewkla and Franco 2022)]
MAGESPDKVEREESSGETTGDDGAVASTDGKKSRAKAERKRGSGPDTDEGKSPTAGSSTDTEASDDAASTDAADASGDAESAASGQGEKAREAGGRGDDRLKAAVAAWVARGDDEPADEASADEAAAEDPVDDPGDETAPVAADEAGDGATEAAGAETEKSGSEEEKSSQFPEGGLPVRQKSAGAEDSGSAEATGKASAGSTAKKGSGGRQKASVASSRAGDGSGGVDQPTAMFRTVRPDSEDGAGADDGEEAARRAERLTSAFFGPGKSGKSSDSGDSDDSGADGSAGAAEQAAGPEPEAEPEAAEPAPAEVSAEETEEQGAEQPSEAEPDAVSESEPDAGPDAEGDAESGAEESAPRVDEPTTAFRTVEPGRAGKKNGSVDQPTAVFRTVEPGEASDADSEAGDADATAKPAKPVDPRIAVDTTDTTGTSDADEPGDDGAGEVAAEQPESETAESETAKSGTAKPEAAKSEAAEPGTEAKPEPEPESESERTSQFVPLKSTDAPPRPPRQPDLTAPPKPLGKPAATPGELPAEAPAPQLTEAELTRQQARPDQAPLDLLAQLTNTPPPRETPLRTAVRRVKIWTPLAVLLAIVFVVAQAVRPLPAPEVSLTASPTYSFQGAKPSVPWPSEGQATLDIQGLGSFGSSGKQKPVPIASVAKVMTAYVILRDHPVKKGSAGATIPVDKKAEDEAGLSAQNESTVEVKRGDKISEREAVQAIMIASANNVARLLARWDAGSEKAFAKKMNAAAEDLGMKNTRYTDPSGLNSSTVSTSDDQVKLAKKAMGINLFRETVRLPGYKDTKGEEHGNWNKLVPLDGVVGIKTGTTTKAGGNLLFAAEQKVGGTEQLIVGAVLGQYRPSILDTVLGESKKLIDTAQDALRAQKVVRKGEVVGYADDQLGGRTPVVATRDVSAVGWSGLKVKLALTDGGKALPHEGSAGDRAGTLTVGDGPGQVRVPVALKEDMSEPGFAAKLTRIL